MSARATIYLSSTYEDLKDYRRVVYEALRKCSYQVIVMEEYVGADERPADQCLNDVGKKADIWKGRNNTILLEIKNRPLPLRTRGIAGRHEQDTDLIPS